MSAPEPPAVTVQHVLVAPPDVVYDQWLDPDALTEWMCPRPARVIRCEVDATVGGSYRFDVVDEGVELTISGAYLELERPRRLRFSWTCTTWPSPLRDSVVTVTLDDRGDGQTLMTIHHALLPPTVVDDHRRGWSRIAAQLESALSG